MNPVRKRLKLSPSKPQNALSSSSIVQSFRPPQANSHDALVLPGASTEEEEEGYLQVEEDTTDSSLVITMGKTQPQPRAIFINSEDLCTDS